MPLSIRDGNQSLTTLSTLIVNSAHVPAHTVVSLGSQAITDIAQAVSGVELGPNTLNALESITVTLGQVTITGGLTNSELRASPVTIGGSVSATISGTPSVTFSQAPVTFGAITGSASILNFPSTQTIGGTVTANVDTNSLVDALSAFSNADGPIPISGTVNLPQAENWAGVYDSGNDCIKIELANLNGDILSPSNPLPISGTVTVGNSVTIGSLPAISGTVTARLQDASGNNLTSTSIGGVQRLNVSLASAATPGGSLPTFVNVYGGSDSGTVRALAVDSSGRTVVTVSNFPATQPVSLTSTTVTVSALPSGALTTRFGSVTTANLSQITTAVTNTSRKYLLAQNISTGSVTIGIGFSPTTTQGIQLTAGAGLTFDAFCPTGAVYWLGAVTGAAWTILEG